MRCFWRAARICKDNDELAVAVASRQIQRWSWEGCLSFVSCRVRRRQSTRNLADYCLPQSLYRFRLSMLPYQTVLYDAVADTALVAHDVLEVGNGGIKMRGRLEKVAALAAGCRRVNLRQDRLHSTAMQEGLTFHASLISLRRVLIGLSTTTQSKE